MPDLTSAQWAIALVAALCVGLGKGGVPGAGNLAVPLFADVFGAKVSVGLLLPVLLCADIVAIVVYRRHAEWRLLLRLFPLMAVGIVVGFFVFDRIEGDALQVVIGSILLGMTALHFLRSLRRRALPEDLPDQAIRWPLAVFTGLLGGFATMLANAAGPVAAFYLMAARLPKYAYIGTAAWLFFLVNLFKLPFQAAADNLSVASLQTSLLFGIVAAGGAFVAPRIVRHINQKLFERLVWTLIVVASLRMIL